MVVFKEENSNLYYKTDSGFIQLNNENLLDASTLNKGLMTSDHVNKLNEVSSYIDANSNGTTVIVEDSSTLISIVSGGNPLSMYFIDNSKIDVGSVALSDLDPMPKPSWELWDASIGYYHTFYSSVNRSYVIKRELPNTLNEVDKKSLFLELEVTTEGNNTEITIIYESTNGELLKKTRLISPNSRNKKLIFGLEDINRYYYILSYGARFGITQCNIYKLGVTENQNRKGGIYRQIPRFPTVGQTYYCVDYPSDNSTKEVLLVYNGREWKQINIVI